MMKAYDPIKWRHSEWMLRKLSFLTKWVHLLIKCVSDVSFRVLINGALSKSFSPSRDIRQEDTLSPFLFVVCSEGFSGLIQREVHYRLRKGLPFGNSSLNLTHLFIANDSLLFQDTQYCLVHLLVYSLVHFL